MPNQIQLTDLIAPSFYTLHNQLHNPNNDNIFEVFLPGGRASTKSSYTATFIILDLHEKLAQGIIPNYVIMRRYAVLLRKSVYAELKKVIERMNLTQHFKFTVSPMEITHLKSGAKLIFVGADDPESIKSITFNTGELSLAWFEEATQWDNFEQIRKIEQSLLRGQVKIKNPRCFITYNPPKSKLHFLNKEIKESKEGRIIYPTTYLDVPKHWLGQTAIALAEQLKTSNLQYYLNEYLGIPTGLGLEVFNNITIRRITDEEFSTFTSDKADLLFGMDYGVNPDPLALVSTCLYRIGYTADFKPLYRLFIYNERVGNNHTMTEIADLIRELNPYNLPTFVDTNEPRTTQYLQSINLNVHKAKKGPGSIESGLLFMQSIIEIVIDDRCKECCEEFPAYRRKTSKEGVLQSQYEGVHHAIDAVRYSLNAYIFN